MTEILGYTATPGATTTVAATGLASGLDVGYQVRKAATNSLAIGRTEISETTPGSYPATFVVPAEPDLYLVIFDWNGGALEELTSVTYQLLVQGISMVEETGLGRIADYARLSLGGETWAGLENSVNFGPDTIALAVEVIKARTMQTPPARDGEQDLPKPVVSYLGKLVALELIPAARSWWAAQILAESVGNDPVEITTYAARDRMMDALQDMLVRQIAADQVLAIELMPDPILRPASTGPDIDEDDDDYRVTDDPRSFPSIEEFPLSTTLPNRARMNSLNGLGRRW